MPITLNCPRCHKPFRVRDESIGGRVRCPSCGSVLQVPSSLAPASHFGLDMPGDVNPAEITGAHRPMAEDVPTSQANASVNDLMLGGTGRRPVVPEPTSANALPAPPSIKPRGASNMPVAPNPPGTSGSVLSQSFGRMEVFGTAGSQSKAPSVNRPPMPAPMPQPNGFGPANEREWRLVRSGLSMIRWGLLLFLFPMLGAAAHGGWLSFDYDNASKDRPGLIQALGWPLWKEMVVAYVAIPIVLAFLLLLLGRFRCASAPRDAHARGLALSAVFFTVLGLIGGGVFGVVQFVGIPEKFTIPEKVVPFIKPIALAVYVPSAILADVFTLLFIGQIGWPLNRPQLQKSVGQLMALVAIIPALFVIANLFYPMLDTMRSALEQTGSPFTGEDDSATTKAIVACGACVVVVALIFLRYASVANAGRRAARNYLVGSSQRS